MVRSRIPLALAAVALLVTPAAGAQRPAPAFDPSRLELPREWSPEAHPYERLLAARGVRLSVAEFEDLRRDLLAGNEAVALAEPEFVFPARAGDLDADGADDLFTFEFQGQDSELVARKGTTGAALWSMPGAFAAIPGDLDQNEVPDAVVLAMQQASVTPAVPSEVEVPGVQVPFASLSAKVQTISMIDGSGTAIWTTPVLGIGERYGDPSGSLATDLDAVVAMSVTDDATGDGRDDVFVATMTFTQYAIDRMIQATATVGRILDGATGLEAGRVAATAVDSIPWVLPASDLSGDGLADLLSFSVGTGEAGSLSASSATGVPIWEQSVPTRFAFPSVHEMSGDGKDDVLLQAFADGGSQRLAYSGATGAALWARPDSGYIDRAGDIDGDGATDFIQLDGMFGSAITATAWSGATGLDLWGPTSYVAPEGAMTVHCHCTDDLTGDGVWDPLTAELVFADPMQMQVRALDGATGAALWAVAADPAEGFPIPLGVDVDDDGAADLGVGFGTGASLVVRTISSADYSPLWSASGESDGFSIGFFGEDVTGDGDPEIVLASVRFVEEWFRGSVHVFDRAGRIWVSH